MQRSKTKIWTGLGAFMLTASGTSAQPLTDDNSDSASAYPQLHAEYLSTDQPLRLASNLAGGGGEGGEGGEAGAAAGANPDEAYMTKLMLMRGHLRIGHALVESGHWDDAMMHFMHPIEEIYGSLEADLRARQVPGFRDALDQLAERVRRQQGGEPFNEAFARVQQHLDDAQQTLDPAVRQAASFRLNVAMRLLQQAALEYNAAIADGQVVNVAEYQDSRGFVWTAEELLTSVADELQQRDTKAWQAMRELLDDIKGAWPTVTPPVQPTQSVAQVLSNISRIDLQASQLR